MPEILVNEIKLKRGQESKIALQVLKSGEPAFATDTKKLFVGDGTTAGGHEIFISSNRIDGVIPFSNLPVGTGSQQVAVGNHTHVESQITDLDKYSQSEVNALLNQKANLVHVHDASNITSGILSIDRIPVGTTSTTVAYGNHNHNGVYEPLLGFTPENVANRGVANGYCPLGSDGLVPNLYLPSSLKEIHVVNDITARDAITDKFVGMRVHVIDATGDPTVSSGWAEYLWTGSAWTKTAERDSIDVILEWANIVGKPSSSVTDIDDAVTKRHTHSNKTLLDYINQNLSTTASVVFSSITSSDGSGISNLNASNLSMGTVAFARLPVGDGSDQVAVGNHTHVVIVDGGELT